jgi:hypothetical protein
MYKEDNQVSTSICLTTSAIHILARSVAFLNSPEVRPIRKQLPHFILLNAMLRFEFLDNVIKPDEARDLHRSLLPQDTFIHIVTGLTRNVNSPEFVSPQACHFDQREKSLERYF